MIIESYKPIGITTVEFINQFKLDNPQFKKVCFAGRLDPLAKGKFARAVSLSGLPNSYPKLIAENRANEMVEALLKRVDEFHQGRKHFFFAAGIVACLYASANKRRRIMQGDRIRLVHRDLASPATRYGIYTSHCFTGIWNTGRV